MRAGPDQGDGPTAVGDLDCLAGLDTLEEFAGPLAQLTHPHRSHVLTVSTLSLGDPATAACSSAQRPASRYAPIREHTMTPPEGQPLDGQLDEENGQ